MRSTGFLLIIAAILAVMDLYVFQIVKSLCQGASPKVRVAVFMAYWLLSASVLLLLVLMPYLHYDNWPKPVKTYLFAIIVGLFFSKLVASLFFLLDDVRRAMMWMIGKLFTLTSL